MNFQKAANLAGSMPALTFAQASGARRIVEALVGESAMQRLLANRPCMRLAATLYPASSLIAATSCHAPPVMSLWMNGGSQHSRRGAPAKMKCSNAQPRRQLLVVGWLARFALLPSWRASFFTSRARRNERREFCPCMGPSSSWVTAPFRCPIVKLHFKSPHDRPFSCSGAL
jgi:hypothetical protein